MQNLITLFSDTSSIYMMFIVSFLGGVIASISPCSLSMLPLIIGYVGGYSEDKPLKTLTQMLLFVLGTSIVFSVIGIICALTGKVFAGNPYFSIIVASVILIMGLNILGVIELQLPVIIKEIPENKFNNFLYPILLGAVFAIIGTPCSTPILASIMGFAAISANIIQSIIMLFLFSLGQGLILIFAGWLTAQIKQSGSKLYNLSEGIMKFSGALLILISIFIYYKIFSAVI